MVQTIKALDRNMIDLSNSRSFGGKRGDNSEAAYLEYCQEVLAWPISENKKEKILDSVYKKYSLILKYESQHVSVMVAGPANYNSRKLDKSDQVLRASNEFYTWFEDIRKQAKNSDMSDVDEIKNKECIRLVEMIDFCVQSERFNPTSDLIKLATVNNEKFVELFEQLQSKYKWRKNSNVYKLYLRSKAGEVQDIKMEVVTEDDNLRAYKEGERYYIKFAMKPKHQLRIALRSRGWWWNPNKQAWSTYLNKFDAEWVSGISQQYEKYI